MAITCPITWACGQSLVNCVAAERGSVQGALPLQNHALQECKNARNGNTANSLFQQQPEGKASWPPSISQLSLCLAESAQAPTRQTRQTRQPRYRVPQSRGPMQHRHNCLINFSTSMGGQALHSSLIHEHLTRYRPMQYRCAFVSSATLHIACDGHSAGADLA